MKIKEILKYDWNYAEYIVTDGERDVICLCNSVPLPNDKILKTGMRVSMLYAFNFNDIKINKLENEDDKIYLLKKEKPYFKYHLRGKIIDINAAIVQVFGLNISLEYSFDKGFPGNYLIGDFIDFVVDRLDSEIEI